MTEGLYERIRQVMPIGEKDLQMFVSKFKPLYLGKGKYFIHEKKPCRKLGFVVKGCMVGFFRKGDEEIIDEFSIENEFITDYRGFLTGSPADKNVKCLEDTQLLVIQYDELQSIFRFSPAIERLGRLMVETLFLNYYEKAKSLLLDDAETRYQKLTKSRPDLIQRVPQYLIATYLNVKPETLSRIRRKIAFK